MTDKQDPKTQGAPFRVSLEVPLKTPNGEVKTITFRRGQVKDMMAAQRVDSAGTR